MEARGETQTAKKIRDRIWFRVMVCVLTLLLVVCATLSAGAAIICYGPSPSAGALFLARLTAPGPAGFASRIYFAFCDIVEILVRLP